MVDKKKRRLEGTIFNLEIFDVSGHRRVKKFKFKDKDLFREWGEVDRIIYQSYGIKFPDNFFEPIGYEQKKKKRVE